MKVIDQLYANYSQFEDRFSQSQNINKRLIGDAQGWLDKAKITLDSYSEKTSIDQHYIAFDMIENGTTPDDILNLGEMIIDKNEQQKGFPTLQGMEALYN